MDASPRRRERHRSRKSHRRHHKHRRSKSRKERPEVFDSGSSSGSESDASLPRASAPPAARPPASPQAFTFDAIPDVYSSRSGSDNENQTSNQHRTKADHQPSYAAQSARSATESLDKADVSQRSVAGTLRSARARHEDVLVAGGSTEGHRNPLNPAHRHLNPARHSSASTEMLSIGLSDLLPDSDAAPERQHSTRQPTRNPLSRVQADSTGGRPPRRSVVEGTKAASTVRTNDIDLDEPLDIDSFDFALKSVESSGGSGSTPLVARLRPSASTESEGRPRVAADSETGTVVVHASESAEVAGSMQSSEDAKTPAPVKKPVEMRKFNIPDKPTGVPTPRRKAIKATKRGRELAAKSGTEKRKRKGTFVQGATRIKHFVERRQRLRERKELQQRKAKGKTLSANRLRSGGSKANTTRANMYGSSTSAEGAAADDGTYDAVHIPMDAVAELQLTPEELKHLDDLLVQERAEYDSDDSWASLDTVDVLNNDHTYKRHLPSEGFTWKPELKEDIFTLEYTPATAEPPIELDTPLRIVQKERKIKIFIVITMYNEDATELKETLRAVASSYDDLAKVGVHWDELAVAIVMDGRAKVHPTTQEFMENELRIFDESMMRLEHNGKHVTAHIFEKTVLMRREEVEQGMVRQPTVCAMAGVPDCLGPWREEQIHQTDDPYMPPMQITVCLKEKNAGKITSHLWFFTALCEQANPKYCFLLDVGTLPQKNALSRLYEDLESNSQIAGSAGEIAVREIQFFNPIVAAQQFEYKVSHYLDKALESIFGYIAVLPGAFSAYRWEAVQGEPLNKYFLLEDLKSKDITPFTANMYLAEDRILCFELVAKERRAWTLHYTKNSVALTDTPQDLVSLLKQRRRWLNGSLLALMYYLQNFAKLMFRAEHSWGRKISFLAQFAMNSFNMALSWFSVGLMFLSLCVIFTAALGPYLAQSEVLRILGIPYLLVTAAQVMAAMGNAPTDIPGFYAASSRFYGTVLIVASLAAMVSVWSGGFSWTLLVTSSGIVGSYAISAWIHNELLWSMSVFVQYLMVLPTYVNVFLIYSICNLHDISWGTKEGTDQNLKAIGGASKVAPEGTKARLNQQIREAESSGWFFGQAVIDDAAKFERKALLPALIVERELRRIAVTAELDAIAEDKQAKEEALRLENEEKKASYLAFRLRLVALWVICNIIPPAAILHYQQLVLFADALAVIVFVTLGVRLFGSAWYQFERYWRKWWLPNRAKSWPKCCPTLPWDRTRNLDFKKRDERRHIIKLRKRMQQAKEFLERARARDWGEIEALDVPDDIKEKMRARALRSVEQTVDVNFKPQPLLNNPEYREAFLRGELIIDTPQQSFTDIISRMPQHRGGKSHVQGTASSPQKHTSSTHQGLQSPQHLEHVLKRTPDVAILAGGESAARLSPTRYKLPVHRSSSCTDDGEGTSYRSLMMQTERSVWSPHTTNRPSPSPSPGPTTVRTARSYGGDVGYQSPGVISPGAESIRSPSSQRQAGNRGGTSERSSSRISQRSGTHGIFQSRAMQSALMRVQQAQQAQLEGGTESVRAESARAGSASRNPRRAKSFAVKRPGARTSRGSNRSRSRSRSRNGSYESGDDIYRSHSNDRRGRRVMRRNSSKGSHRSKSSRGSGRSDSRGGSHRGSHRESRRTGRSTSRGSSRVKRSSSKDSAGRSSSALRAVEAMIQGRKKVAGEPVDAYGDIMNHAADLAFPSDEDEAGEGDYMTERAKERMMTIGQ